MGRRYGIKSTFLPQICGDMLKEQDTTGDFQGRHWAGDTVTAQETELQNSTVNSHQSQVSQIRV